MSLTTECPRCVTVFHVTSGQLREAQGWVRCGICQEVFGAQAHALPDLEEVPADHALALRQEASLEDAPRASAHNASAPPANARTRHLKQAHKGRWGWLLLAALAASLLAQLGVQQRHQLSERFPVAAAWLQSVCAVQACSFRNIQDIAITDSSFNAPDASHFQLSAVLANRSNLALEAPSLVLALTDSADRVVARKFYGPRQWGAHTSTLPAESTWPVVLWIAFDPPPDAPPIVGYRLKAIYP